MRTRGAILRQSPGELEVVDLEVDDPRDDEVQVRLAASGLCHSDDHPVQGDTSVGMYPFAFGHEGAGIITKASPNYKGIDVGDHVVFSAMPSCGHCRWCSTGRQNLCDLGAGVIAGPRWTDGSFRVRLTDGTPVGQMCGISTFLETTTVSINSVVKIDKDIPLEKACLVGCGVSTGWGSSVNAGEVKPGDTVVVMGIGGLGSAALQGARHAGASNVIAVDPVAFKREAAPKFGATHVAATIAEAQEIARPLTNGQGPDSVVITVGILQPDHVAQALETVRKAGTVVVTALGNREEIGLPVPAADLTLSQKRIQGCCFGAANGTWDVKRLLNMYKAGQLNLDDMITRTYTLDQVAQGYRDLRGGANIRGVILFD